MSSSNLQYHCYVFFLKQKNKAYLHVRMHYKGHCYVMKVQNLGMLNSTVLLIFKMIIVCIFIHRVIFRLTQWIRTHMVTLMQLESFILNHLIFIRFLSIICYKSKYESNICFAKKSALYYPYRINILSQVGKCVYRALLI